ncbi:signal peptidase I [Brevibacterium siliguriense]|uniref:signal peptidase I n=1 Tax=Brevibacterium siliguriense TaxID=1136497 RepID=UPI001E4296DB|nr:signal peptidase I [Brevibacterium siliguriense]
MSAWLGGAVLNILAVLGVVCIVLVILGFVFNVSIIMFKTGSMSPTISAGSASLVREIPAEDMQVGDIVTVDRGEKVLPVTHRVTEILSADESTGAVRFEMKGDANEEKDPDPYTAETVRKVMFSVPGVAPILQQWRNPFLLGSITIAASLLVVWAFWPRRGDDDDDSLAEAARPRARSPRHAIALPVAVAVAVGGQAVPGTSFAEDALAARADRSVAAAAEETGDILRMRGFGDVETMRHLSPGASATWTVDVWADAPEPGTVTVSIGAGAGAGADALADSLSIDVRECAMTEAEVPCPEGSELLTREVLLSELEHADNGGLTLLDMDSDDSRRVEVTATLAVDADARAVAGTTAGVRVIAEGFGDKVSTGPGDPGDPGVPGDSDSDSDGTVEGAADGGGSGELPWTGVDGWQWFLVAAFILVVTGSAIVSRTRRARVS